MEVSQNMLQKTRRFFIYLALYLVSIGVVASLFLLHPIPRTPLPIVREIIIFFASVLLIKYFIYMALSPVYDLWVARYRVNFRDTIALYRPKVSVIIPAWNESVGILETVRSLLANTYQPLEIVIVNDGSTDNSDALIREFITEREHMLANDGVTQSDSGKMIVYHYKENGGKGAALNTAIALSTGEIIVSIDADCYVTPTAIENFVTYFANPKVMAAVGNVKIGNTQTIVGTVQYLEFLFSFYFKKADSLMNTIYIIGGAAGAFRREMFEQIGGYHVGHITEDIDLSVRIQRAGMKIVYAADAVVYTEGASDIHGLMKQRLRWKWGRFKTFWEHRLFFFSSQDGNNPLLTWGILPLAIFGDIQLFGELFFLLFLYAYSFWTDNFSSFISGIIVVSSMFVVQIVSEGTEAKKLSFLALAPIGWLLFYITTYVEHNALLKSISGSIAQRQPQWQRWQRKGVKDSIIT
jgi:biofilm PGA synthesis N-glycosyltransferase PgaC